MDDHLLYRAIKGQTTPAEQHSVEQWRRASSANESRYQELAAVLAATTSRLKHLVTEPPPVLEVLAAASRRERSHGNSLRTRRIAFAAGIAALLIAGVAIDRSGMLGGSSTFGFEEMVTGDNQTATVSLRDGSVMRLAPRSHARFRMREGSREVYLTGHAFFSVAKKNGLPFTVKTQGGDVTVLGTQFDLNATNNDVRLVVVEGKVALTAARGGETKVTRGEEARVVEGQLLPTIRLTEAREETRWVGRFLAFQNAPLSEVAKEIERTYGVKVSIADRTLAEQTVTTWFSDRPLPEVVRAVCAIVATECAVNDSEVTLGKLSR